MSCFLPTVVTSSLSADMASWYTFLYENHQHPCNITGSKCCHFWTSALNHNLKPIMKVMRMATGRGQSHFNISDFLEPFIENNNTMTYPLDVNSDDAYYNLDKTSEARDKTSFIPACTYASREFKIGDNCKLFQPVVTDFGICYSFNAEPLNNMLKNSTFTEAFNEAYQYDLIESEPEKAKGAGDNFALRFMVDNSRYLKKKSQTKPFKIEISSRKGYFDALSVAKQIKPGYELTLDVQPIEVYGTQSLHEVEEEARKCKFSYEVTNESSMFKTYSQSSCAFECQVNKARDKCLCTPWNFPSPPSMKNHTICDLYGNYCFRMQMTDPKIIENCTTKCPSDCEDVRFSINEKEVPINIQEYCDSSKLDGYIMTRALLMDDYFPFYYNYHKFEQMVATNRTDQLPETLVGRMKEECHEIMKNDIAVVTVRMETSKYIKTVMSKRNTFADKIASFGK